MFHIDEVMSKERANNLNPIVLAFVGDAVYSLFVRDKNDYICKRCYILY